MKMRTGTKIVIYTLLILWALVVLFPMYWAATTSFKQKSDVFQGPYYIPWVDYEPTTRWWEEVFTTEWSQVRRPLVNSLIVALVSSALATYIGMMGAYGLTRFTFKPGPLRNRDILLWIVSNRMMPPIVVAIGVFIMFHWVNLTDTRLGLILIYLMFNLPLAVWIMRNFLSQIPLTLEEAAQVDGASRWQMFSKVVVPMTWPSLTATFLICLMFAWNEFLFALFLTFSESRTIPILIASQHFQRGPQWWDISVLLIIAIAPMIIITISLQRFLIKGLVPQNK
jgi:multiple sugar transport system permease protein